MIFKNSGDYGSVRKCRWDRVDWELTMALGDEAGRSAGRRWGVRVFFHKPGFDGLGSDVPHLKSPGLSRVGRTVNLNAVVPPEVFNSTRKSIAFAIDTLRQAVRIADETYRRRKIRGFDAAAAHRLIDRAERRLIRWNLSGLSAKESGRPTMPRVDRAYDLPDDAYFVETKPKKRKPAHAAKPTRSKKRS